MAQLVDRAQDIITAQNRLRSLLDANRSIVSELTLAAVLRRIVDAARDVAEARYAALGVIGADGSLEQFVHVGMDAATVAAIGDLPEGARGARRLDRRSPDNPIARHHRRPPVLGLSRGAPPDANLPGRTDPGPRRRCSGTSTSPIG